MARLEDLELRIKLLEARLRAVTAERPLDKAKAPAAGKRKKPRPRCPGCVLELPPGRRTESCGWCGFQLEVVGGPARRQATR